MTSTPTDPQACPNYRCHGNPFLYCPECPWREEAAPNPVSQPPSVGRIVLYRLSENDAQVIRNRRIAERTISNAALAGDVYPATIVRVWPGDSVNLQVTLDGPDSYWATSVSEGTDERQWSWPPRV